MKQKLERRLNHLKNNPEFQSKLQQMRPKKSIWGFLGVVLIFFVPEVLNVLYYQEINEWIVDFARTAPSHQMGDMLVWMSQKTFDGEISWVNLALGVAFLIWLFRGR
jgi:CDP-diglyceride synthetase